MSRISFGTVRRATYFLGLDMAAEISSPQDNILASRSPRNPVRLSE